MTVTSQREKKLAKLNEGMGGKKREEDWERKA